MKELGFETKLTRLVKATLESTKCRVKVQNDMSDVFAVLEGLKQGDALSCLLFNLALEVAMRRAGIQTNKTLVNRTVQVLDFAVDLDLASRTNTAAEHFQKSENPSGESGFDDQRIETKVHEDRAKYGSQSTRRRAK